MKQTKLDENALIEWVRLARTPNVGPVTFEQLLKRFSNPSIAVKALPDITIRSGRKTALFPPARKQIEEEINQTRAYGGHVIAACEPDFPEALRALTPPPPVVSIVGELHRLQMPSIAIVGSRNASGPGRKIAREMAYALGQAGYCIVSGLARGIDGEAHGAAISTGTVAVLAGGIDHIYPPQHEALYQAIRKKGVILSESPFGKKATAHDFPRRNRLITGLSLGVIIVEAAERSGSLISARTALEQGREVMAVPGSPLEPRAKGANRLLQQGATLVESAEDVLRVVENMVPPRLFEPSDWHYDDHHMTDTHISNHQIDTVRNIVSPIPLSVDEIARMAGMGTAHCVAILVELELAGDIITLPGGLAALRVN